MKNSSRPELEIILAAEEICQQLAIVREFSDVTRAYILSQTVAVDTLETEEQNSEPTDEQVVPIPPEPGTMPEPEPEPVSEVNPSRPTPRPKPQRARFIPLDDNLPKSRKKTENKDEDLVGLYLKKIGEVPLLTKDQEVHLAQTYEKGRLAAVSLREDADELSQEQQRILARDVRIGERAKEDFVKANLRLVVSIAKRYQASGIPLLDLIQEGNIGLMHAVDKFEWRKGFKFSTYATWWIRQSINRGISNTDSEIRLPVHAGEELKQLNKAKQEIALRKGNGYRATVAELASLLEWTPEKVDKVTQLYAIKSPVSMDEKLREDGDATLGDVTADPMSGKEYDEVARHIDLTKGINEALSTLNAREQLLLRLRYGFADGEPHTLEDVGKVLNITRERVRQIESRALSKLRHPANRAGQGLMTYLT